MISKTSVLYDSLNLGNMQNNTSRRYSSEDNEEDTAPIENNEVLFNMNRNSWLHVKMPPGVLKFLSVAILCFINLINYMDRYTVAGVLPKVEKFFHLDHTQSGLIQTSFVVSYMIFAPIFGYLGDRYSRKFIIAGGVFFWSLTTLLCSFIPANRFDLFITLRSLVGIGEASYSTIAPTIIADLFTGTMRTRMLALFYFAIPIGSGMGYIVGTELESASGQWQWALRLTPALGVISVFLNLLFLREPPRGESEGITTELRSTKLSDDLRDIFRNRSFVLSTGGFTCVTFAAGALAWWAPTYMEKAITLNGEKEADPATIGLIFGVITCFAGLTGVIVGSGGAQYYRKFNPAADPLICGIGVLSSVPLLFIGCVIARQVTSLSWTLIFFGEVFLCMNWAIVADILLYCVIPTRRSMAEAIQILTSHALGDACSPYIVGAVSDSIASTYPDPQENYAQYISMQYALFITVFVLVFGALLFFATAWYIVGDKERCERLSHGGEVVVPDALSSHSLPNPVENDIGSSWSINNDRHALVT